MNALLCGVGHNIRKILRRLRLFYALCGLTLCQLLALLLPPVQRLKLDYDYRDVVPLTIGA
jgi:hypothetical protein